MKNIGYNDYGFRQLDPQLGRWHVVDALAEKFGDESPYNYAGNNPVSNIDIAGLQKYTLNEKFVYSMFGTSEFQRGGGGITRNIGPTLKDHSDYDLSEEAKNGMDFQTWYNEKSKHQYDNYSTYGTNINNTGGHYEWRRKAYSQNVEYQIVIINQKIYTTLVPIEVIDQRVWVNDSKLWDYFYSQADIFISIGAQGGWRGEFVNILSEELAGWHWNSHDGGEGFFIRNMFYHRSRSNFTWDFAMSSIGLKHQATYTLSQDFKNSTVDDEYEINFGMGLWEIETTFDDNYDVESTFIGIDFGTKEAVMLGIDTELKFGFKF